MTLIEALAGLVMLGSLLTVVTIARSRANQQYARAQQRLAASRAADSLLAEWFSSPAPTVPLNAHGTLPQAPHLRWRTTSRSNAGATAMRALITRLEVFDPASRSGAPVLSLELLVPAPAPAAQPGGAR